MNKLRHQEREEMKALTRKLADAQATVEALQRERDEANLYRDQARANQESLAACVDRDVRKIKDLRAALDAERERYELLNVERNAIDDKRHVLHEQLANTIEAAAQQEGELAEIQALAANLESQLSALQGLVRVYFTEPDPHKWTAAYRTLKRMGLTLPATTPAPIDAAETHERMFNHTDRHPEAL